MSEPHLSYTDAEPLARAVVRRVDGVVSPGSFTGLRDSHVVYLAGACRIRSTGFVYGGPFSGHFVGLRKVDIVYLAGARHVTLYAGARTYGYLYI